MKNNLIQKCLCGRVNTSIRGRAPIRCSGCNGWLSKENWRDQDNDLVEFLWVDSKLIARKAKR